MDFSDRPRVSLATPFRAIWSAEAMASPSENAADSGRPFRARRVAFMKVLTRLAMLLLPGGSPAQTTGGLYRSFRYYRLVRKVERSGASDRLTEARLWAGVREAARKRFDSRLFSLAVRAWRRTFGTMVHIAGVAGTQRLSGPLRIFRRPGNSGRSVSARYWRISPGEVDTIRVKGDQIAIRGVALT